MKTATCRCLGFLALGLALVLSSCTTYVYQPRGYSTSRPSGVTSGGYVSPASGDVTQFQ